MQINKISHGKETTAIIITTYFIGFLKKIIHFCKKSRDDEWLTNMIIESRSNSCPCTPFKRISAHRNYGNVFCILIVFQFMHRFNSTHT